MIPLLALWRALTGRLSHPAAPLAPRLLLRAGGLWWRWLTDRTARARLRRVGWRLVPIIAGGLEASLGFLRIRVVNTSPLYYFTDGFEGTGSGVTATLWHSLGTEAGTDNSLSYWTQDAGSWTYGSHLVTAPFTGAGATYMHGGHADWGDGTFTCRFKWVTGAFMSGLMHFTATNSWVAASASGAQIFLQKDVAGVVTTVGTAVANLVNGTFYWLQISGTGTSYTASIYNDTGPGTIFTLINNVVGTISDAALQNGYAGLRNDLVANGQFGGAFANVCQFTGTPPDGTKGQAWAPVVTTGEPAFAWSKINPQAGTYSASIQNLGSASGNGAWQQVIRLFSGSNVTLSAQAKASAGTANVSAGGLTTGNAGTSFGALSAQGAITTNPTVSCNYSGAIGTAYFDSLSITNPAYEITNDLPHLHQTHIEVVAMQPGNPGSSALGSWTGQLHPPGTEGYAAAKPIYDQLDYFQRLEFYISPDGASLGKLYYAGIITGKPTGHGRDNKYELSGVGDLFWLNYSRPFPGETLQLSYNSGVTTTADYRQARHYFATQEPGATDTFNPFTAGNYISTNAPALTAGSWSGTTDNGNSVASCTTGSGALLLSKLGARARCQYDRNFVQITGRLSPSSDATNAGGCGVGLSTSNLNAQNSIIAWIRAKKNGSTGNWDLDVVANVYAAGALTQTVASSALTATQDGEGFIPFDIYLQAGESSLGSCSLAVNGKLIFSSEVGGTPIGGAWDPGGTSGGNPNAPINAYPMLFFATPATGTATCYLTNLVQLVRFSDDQNANLAIFKPGNIGTPLHSLPVFTEPGPTFLEIITRCAVREGWYWRYTPQAYVVGTRTLGTIDFIGDPGTDRGTNQQVVFSSPAGTLLDLQLTANVDQLASGTVLAGTSGADGGGIAIWRDIGTLTKYGVIDDQTLAVPLVPAGELQRTAQQVVSNKVNLSAIGSKTAIVLRDPQTADVWRELDKVMIHDPEVNINYLVARVIGYIFDEGQAEQTLALDQFSIDDPTVPARRLQQGVFQTALRFGNR